MLLERCLALSLCTCLTWALTRREVCGWIIIKWMAVSSLHVKCRTHWTCHCSLSLFVVTNPVLFVFYSIWCHLVTLLLWLTTAPSFPFFPPFLLYFFPCIIFLFLVFPDVYFVLSQFDSILVFLNQNTDLTLLLSLSYMG